VVSSNDHHHNHTHLQKSSVSDGRFTHLGGAIHNINKFKPRPDRMPFQVPKRYRGIYRGLNKKFIKGF
jgi:hypothetical protein